MSDTAQGPGWWMASDGKWYPPQDHPDQQAAGGGGGTGDGYPARFDLDPGDGRIANWRALVHIFMAIPHFIVLYALGFVRNVLWIISFFAILFVKRIPTGIFGVQAMVVRYSNRVTNFVLLLTEEYPPFEFSTATEDPGGYPARTSIDEPDEVNRWLPLVKWLLAIPHFIVLAVLAIVAVFAYIGGWFAVLFTGRMPEGIRNYLVGVHRWATRVSAYFLLLRDEYPPFSLA